MELVDLDRAEQIYARHGLDQGGLGRLGRQHHGRGGRPGRHGRLRRQGGRRSARRGVRHDIRATGVEFTSAIGRPPGRRRRRGGRHRPLPRAGHRRRRAHHGHPPRGGHHHRPGRRAGRARGPGPDPLPRGLPLGPPPGQGGHAPGHRRGPRQRRLGRPVALGPVLRRAPPARVPRPAARRCRRALRQRGGDHLGCSVRRRFDAALEAAEETGLLVAVTRGAERLGGADGAGARCGARRPRWPRWSTPPGPATCSPPASSTGSPTGRSPERCARLGALCAGRGHRPPRGPARSGTCGRWPPRPGCSRRRRRRGACTAPLPAQDLPRVLSLFRRVYDLRTRCRRPGLGTPLSRCSFIAP